MTNDASRFTNDDRPADGDRGPDCLAHLLVDLQGMRLGELTPAEFQEWLTAVCELLAAWDKTSGLPVSEWLEILAQRIYTAYPGCWKTVADVREELASCLASAVRSKE